jgi:hypothetical protein
MMFRCGLTKLLQGIESAVSTRTSLAFDRLQHNQTLQTKKIHKMETINRTLLIKATFKRLLDF